MSNVLHSAPFAIAITIAVYWVALRVHRRYLWANPLVLGTVLLVLCLYGFHIPFSSYRRGGDIFTSLLGPATVALAVPMYKQMRPMRKALGRLIAVVTVGSIVGMTTAALTVWMLGAPHSLVAAAVPKSVTTPIAVQVAQELGGDPAITVAMVLLTGVLGSAIGPAVLRLAGIRHEHAIGAAIGTSSHAIGTASLIRQSEVQGSVSSLAMVLAGVLTSVLAIGLTWVWR